YPGHFAGKPETVSTSTHQPTTLEPRQLFIDNEYRPARAGGMFETIDPSTETVLTEVTRGRAEDVDAAVHAADAARHGPWRDLSPAARGQILLKLADALEARKDEIARLETLDVGKPLKESRGDVGGVC